MYGVRVPLAGRAAAAYLQLLLLLLLLLNGE